MKEEERKDFVNYIKDVYDQIHPNSIYIKPEIIDYDEPLMDLDAYFGRPAEEKEKEQQE